MAYSLGGSVKADCTLALQKKQCYTQYQNHLCLVGHLTVEDCVNAWHYTGNYYRNSSYALFHTICLAR
eukprot:g53605.t1